LLEPDLGHLRERGLRGDAGEVAEVAVDHGQAGAHVAEEVEGGNAVTECVGGEGVSEIVDPARRLNPGRDLRGLPLAVTEIVQVEVAARFVYGDFRRLHRSGIIACRYRAAEWDHKEIELAAHDLLQLLDRTRARTSR
jgi:hypothetical protein